MKQVSSFLDKFIKVFKKDEDIKDQVFLVIKNNTGLNFNKENLSIKNKIAYINEKPHFKSEVFMRKDKILKQLIGIISDIR